MTSKQNISQLLCQYSTGFPAEVDRLGLFTAFMDQTPPRSLFDRKNFNGHITTSAFIVDIARSEMLLLKHKSLNRWLQPGGHAEDGDASLVASALREAVEETGIGAAQLAYYPINDAVREMPFDIDSHYIPANAKKEENGHYHHDFRYVFVFNGERTNVYNTEEATGLRWVAFTELDNDTTFSFVIEKIRPYLNIQLKQH